MSDLNHDTRGLYHISAAKCWASFGGIADGASIGRTKGPLRYAGWRGDEAVYLAYSSKFSVPLSSTPPFAYISKASAMQLPFVSTSFT